MELRGSETERNLLIAFAGESQARNRYAFFSEQARKEGLIQIADIFAETADQEMAHALRLFKFMEGGEVEITASYPAGLLGKTMENLRAAASGEHYEWTDMYPSFANMAREEGFNHIAKAMEAIAVAEKQHERRYLMLADNIETGRVFHRELPVVWRCRKCGYLHSGNDAPEGCPACAHPKAYFELLGENW